MRRERNGWRLYCKTRILSGPNAGKECGRTATCMIVVASTGEPCCGTHARAYLPAALARLAYWNVKERSWS